MFPGGILLQFPMEVTGWIIMHCWLPFLPCLTSLLSNGIFCTSPAPLPQKKILLKSLPSHWLPDKAKIRSPLPTHLPQFTHERHQSLIFPKQKHLGQVKKPCVPNFGLALAFLFLLSPRPCLLLPWYLFLTRDMNYTHTKQHEPRPSTARFAWTKH